VLVLTRSAVASLLNMEEVIGAVEEAHAALACGDAHDLGPADVAVPSSSALLIPMAAVVSGGSGGVKLLTDTPGNAGRSRPTQQSTIVVVDTSTGACDAFLDGAMITRYRTAAASAVATKFLARDDADVLGFVGAGALARTHLLAIRAVRPIRRLVVWSRSAKTADGFAHHAASQGLLAEVVETPEQVVSSSDILCTLTPSRAPLVRGAWFRPGLHVNAVGAPPRCDHREIDTDGIRRSRVVVDSFGVAAQISGDVLIPLVEGAISEDHFRDELGQVILGERPGRTSTDEITLYNSTGIGTQDIATARLVVSAARRAGIGTEIELTA
jgi:ornithine cyclodeaminase/alanine dehydrogenase-like protein (mu-crystallin family)